MKIVLVFLINISIREQIAEYMKYNLLAGIITIIHVCFKHSFVLSLILQCMCIGVNIQVHVTILVAKTLLTLVIC